MKENRLALLADAYTSPLLLNSLMRQRIPAFVQGERLEKELRAYCQGLILLSIEDAVKMISKHSSLILTNAEDILPFLIEHSGNKARIENIRLFKDKVRTRQFLSRIYPDYFFIEADINRLSDIELPPGREYIIKPLAGFFSIGIRKIRDKSDLAHAVEDISREIKENAGNVSPDVVSPDRFIIEEYLPGDEYACDAYFNSKGEGVVLGIYRHPFLNDEDFRDIVYYTNPELMREMLPMAESFLKMLSSERKIVNFPLHMEFRVKGDLLVPIEINPMRFGGFSLSDLTFFAYGIKANDCYFQSIKPDWDEILSKAGQETYYWVLSELHSRTDASFDHEEYADTFEGILAYCKLDTRRYPAFSIAFASTKNLDEALKYLSFNFEEYIEAPETKT